MHDVIFEWALLKNSRAKRFKISRKTIIKFKCFFFSVKMHGKGHQLGYYKTSLWLFSWNFWILITYYSSFPVEQSLRGFKDNKNTYDFFELFPDIMINMQNSGKHTMLVQCCQNISFVDTLADSSAVFSLYSYFCRKFATSR